MELFAIRFDSQDLCQVIANESMRIIGYLEQGEKGFYIHLKDKDLLWEIIEDYSQEERRDELRGNIAGI